MWCTYYVKLPDVHPHYRNGFSWVYVLAFAFDTPYNILHDDGITSDVLRGKV